MEQFTDNKNLSKEENALLIMDFFHRTMMHHFLWFSEIQHQFGREKAFEVLDEAWEKSRGIQLKRLAKILNFNLVDGIPEPLLQLSDHKLESLRDGMGINWLVNDGVWFQTVEFTKGMNDAKRCNDSCWGQFSPMEAWSIKRLLKLGKNPGIAGLKRALEFRLYAFVNKQSFSDVTEKSMIFQMNECRVQVARKRKGLDDYPCKSGGLVEYTTFAEAIDSRIKTTVISCPPDPHPEDYYCAWRFYIEE